MRNVGTAFVVILNLVLNLALNSCATTSTVEPGKNSSAGESKKYVAIETSYLGFGPSQVSYDSDGTVPKTPLKNVEVEMRSRYPTAATHLDRSKTFLGISRKMFWIGLGGLVLSQASESQDFILGRTTGNAFWGLGWAMWLGFLGLTQAEYDDVQQEIDSHPDVSGAHSAAGFWPTTHADERLYGTSHATVLVWRIAEF